MLKKNLSKLEIILSLIAISLCSLILLKAIIDIDTNYDVGWYHLPFAARIWGIIPKSSFMAGLKVEYRYDGFPLLAHFFQGLLWKLTNRVQSTNLVGYFSVIIYFFFLRSFFKVPLYLSAIAIFTIPLVLIHAATSFVDLPGNIGVTVVAMMLHKFYSQVTLPSKKELLAAFLGATMAANTKPQLIVLIGLLWWIVVIRLAWLYFTQIKPEKRQIVSTILVTAIASTLIFATPIKNVALYGNPFYPIKIQVAGIVLNHQATPETYQEGNRPQKWLQSIFEIETPEWSADQFNRTGNNKLLDRAGGFFGAYVIFNLLLLISLTIKEFFNNQILINNQTHKSLLALIFILLISLISANFPQSHELRYLMFWMITLVSFNLCLISSFLDKNYRWLKKRYLGLVYLLFLIIVCVKIESYYLKPDFRTLKVYLNNIINPALIKKISPNTTNCLISRYQYDSLEYIPTQHVFYYSSYFHPEVGFDYSIKAVESAGECVNSEIITPKN